MENTIIFLCLFGYFRLSLCNSTQPMRLSTQSPDNRTKELVQSLIASNNPFVRPNQNGPATEVECTVFVSAFGGINVVTMDYKVDIYLRLKWLDNRMQLDPSLAEPITVLGSAIDSVWRPDIYFPNEKTASLHNVLVPNRLMKVFRNGTVIYSVRIAIHAQCLMYLAAYPMDKQNCNLHISSYSYDMSDVLLRWSESPLVLGDNMFLPQFKLSGYYVSDTCDDKNIVGYSCLAVHFELQREFGYYILQTYVPSMLVVILSWVSFWINKDAVPARITLGVTTVLSITTQLSGSKEDSPKISYPKALDIWMTMCMVFIFASIIEFAFVNALSRGKERTQGGFGSFDSLHRRSKDVSTIENGSVPSVATNGSQSHPLNNHRPPTIAAAFENRRKLQEWLRQDDLAKRLDRISRILFPVAFLCTNFVYWLYYLYLI